MYLIIWVEKSLSQVKLAPSSWLETWNVFLASFMPCYYHHFCDIGLITTRFKTWNLTWLENLSHGFSQIKSSSNWGQGLPILARLVLRAFHDVLSLRDVCPAPGAVSRSAWGNTGQQGQTMQSTLAEIARRPDMSYMSRPRCLHVLQFRRQGQWLG